MTDVLFVAVLVVALAAAFVVGFGLGYWNGKIAPRLPRSREAERLDALGHLPPAVRRPHPGYRPR